MSLNRSKTGQEDVRSTVMWLLGCTENVFANADALRKKYGLKEETVSSSPLESSSSGSALSASGVDEHQFLLGLISKHASIGLRKSAKENQQAAPLKRKVTLAISDG